MPRPAMLRALRHRNFRLFFTGQGVSLTGTWITRIATAWLVYRLTGSELLLGVVAFASQIPNLFLMPVAGVLADRWNRRRVLIVTQAMALVQSGLLAVFTLTGLISVPLIIILQVAQGFITALDTPVRQAFVVSMIDDRADLANAIALNSSLFNASRIIGPSVGGLLIAAVGEGWCFAIDSASYLFVILSLLMMRLPEALPRSDTGRIFDELTSGLRYALESVPIRSLLILMAVASIAGMPYNVLMPAMARGVLGGGAETLGILMTGSGIGALAGAIWLASRHDLRGLSTAIAIAGSVFGAGLIAFSFARSVPVAMVLLFVVGAGFMIQTAAANTIVQTIVEEEKRGRIMALFAMAFLGTMPIGGLIAGSAAEHIGTPMTIAIGGAICMLSSLWFAREPQIAQMELRMDTDATADATADYAD